MKKYNIFFSPPDISDTEIELVADALRSGWITTGPKTKLLESKIAEWVGTPKCVCLNSQTSNVSVGACSIIKMGALINHNSIVSEGCCCDNYSIIKTGAYVESHRVVEKRCTIESYEEAQRIRQEYN